MAQVSISLNKKTYRFECGEDEVERLEKLANYLKSKLDVLVREHGPIGDERLVIMAALTLADELFDARADVDDLLEGASSDQVQALRTVSGEGSGEASGLGGQAITNGRFRKP